MMQKQSPRPKSKVLVCFNCLFKKVVKSEVEGLIIIRNHNALRDRISNPLHIMKLLEKDEIEDVNGLPYYDGFVYRALCHCGTVFDRKSEEGIKWTMYNHINGAINPSDHYFEEMTDDENTLEEVFKRIPRKDFIAKTKNVDTKYWESYHRYNLSDKDLAQSTSLEVFDPNAILWENKVQSFNWVNKAVFDRLKNLNCSFCYEKFDSYRKMYWHFQKEHTIIGNEIDPETRKALFGRLQKLQKRYSDWEWQMHWKEREDLRTEIEALENKLHFYVKQGQFSVLHGYEEWRDVTISMLQQIVMLEDSFSRKSSRRSFMRDRRCNAMYQLNRRHGISQIELQNFIYENFSTSKTSSMVGADLFHGMVWSENKAPDWLDEVVKNMGEEIGI